MELASLWASLFVSGHKGMLLLVYHGLLEMKN